MSTDFEQRLRAEMEQVAVRPRPGLAKEAYRSHRAKRRLTRTVAATGTAMAIAAGTVAGVAAATASPVAIPAQTTAYIASRMSSALAATGEISNTIETTRFGPPDNSQVVIESWQYGTRVRQLETVKGRPFSDGWGQSDHGSSSTTRVDYRNRSYSIESGHASGSVSQSSPCGRHAPILGALGAPAAAFKPVIESGLRCGLFHVAGHQRVDGIDAIKLTGNSYRGIMLGDGGITLWVDPHTYLPLQMAGTQASFQGTPQAAIWVQFRWLPPTRANLTQLTGTIPPGFHRT